MNNLEIMIEEFINIRVYLINNYLVCNNVQKIKIPSQYEGYSEYIKSQIEQKTKVKIEI